MDNNNLISNKSPIKPLLRLTKKYLNNAFITTIMRMRDIKPGMAVSTKDGIFQGITISKPRPGGHYAVGGYNFGIGNKIRYIQAVRLTNGAIFHLWTDHLKKL